jgi:hypothetical protein
LRRSGGNVSGDNLGDMADAMVAATIERDDQLSIDLGAVLAAA